MNQIKAGAILNYIIIGLNTLVGLLYTPYMLRCLGQNDYGLYSLVASVIAYLTILDFGFGNAIIRYTAKLRAEGKSHEQWEMFGMFVVVYSIIGLAALIGGLILYLNVDCLFDRTMSVSDIRTAKTMMALLTVNLAFTFPLSIFGSIISAYENFIFQRIISIVRILLSTAVMVALLAMGFKAIALVIVNTVFNLLTLLINYFYAKRKLRIKIIFNKINIPFLKEIATYSFWIFLNVIMDKVYWGTGQFVLGSVAGTVAVAIFSVAILLQHMYMTFSSSITSVLLPKITTMISHKKSNKEISDLFISTGRIQYLILGLILSGFIVFGQSFINLWAGENYSQAFIITLIFFVTLLVPLIQNTGIVILQARNQMKFRSLLYLAISMVSLVLQILLSKRYGVLGCAVAIGGALIVGQGLIMNIYYATKQAIDIGAFWIQILKASFVPVLFTLTGIFITHLIDFYNWQRLVIGIFMFICAYVPALWITGMNDYERTIIMKPLSKLFSRL